MKNTERQKQIRDKLILNINSKDPLDLLNIIAPSPNEDNFLAIAALCEIFVGINHAEDSQ